MLISGGILAVVAGVVLYGLFANGLIGGQMIGTELAPDVTLATANGHVRLSELRGQPLLLYFSFPG